ncbi:uncharacterized protein AMSG_05508 [Thecamonas trahens ATCC 50062]|uniref:NYN domain-containing protein n=1 Tax=Thecamonas trahens ATCC 50062 TaxID=461836 RepID=A0A0L0DAY0_THETB|nr:hypothetical protein AMSG_05508 [Thecamonas trahens ATCC 50062]KNC49492.1 hypothetical protein AMSG_05508 [Thecamonas trahens ATCC 50062]|eukprot:XP_013757911.1 hypothetical protein AMSG_05508 [Thecamonas trahens ATCC 50062]
MSAEAQDRSLYIPSEDPDHGRRFGIYWDYENAHIPSGADIGNIFVRMRAEVERHDGRISCFKCFNAPESHRVRMQDLSIECINASKKNRKEAADHRLVVDMFRFALENPNTHLTFVLISGDSDFAYPLATLRNYSHRIWVFHPKQASKALRDHAHLVRPWKPFCTAVRTKTTLITPRQSSSSAPAFAGVQSTALLRPGLIGSPATSPPASASTSASIPTLLSSTAAADAAAADDGNVVDDVDDADDADDDDDNDDDDNIDVDSEASAGTVASSMLATHAIEALMEIFEEHVDDDGSMLRSTLGIKLQEKYPSLVQRRGDARTLIKRAMDLGLLVPNPLSQHSLCHPSSPIVVGTDSPLPGDEAIDSETLAILLIEASREHDETGKLKFSLGSLKKRLKAYNHELVAKSKISEALNKAKSLGYINVIKEPVNRTPRSGQSKKSMQTMVVLEAQGLRLASSLAAQFE